MADAADLKSALRKEVWVRVPPSAHSFLFVPSRLHKQDHINYQLASRNRVIAPTVNCGYLLSLERRVDILHLILARCIIESPYDNTEKL